MSQFQGEIKTESNKMKAKEFPFLIWNFAIRTDLLVKKKLKTMLLIQDCVVQMKASQDEMKAKQDQTKVEASLEYHKRVF